jgi:hypothetical protein
MKTVITFIICLLVCSTVYSDIDVKPQYAANEKIVVKVLATNVPEGAKLRGSFQVTDAEWDLVSVPNAAELRASATDLKNIITSVPVEAQSVIKAAVDEIDKAVTGETFHVWAATGRHTITASGVWVLTKDVTVGDQTFPVLVDFGQYSYSRSFIVGEDDVVPPPGPRRAVILEETKDRTPAFALLKQQLLQEFLPDKMQILDDDLAAASKYLPLIQESVRPVLLVLEGDKLVRAIPCPVSVSAVKAEVAK